MPKQSRSAVAAALSSLPHMSEPLAGAGIARCVEAPVPADDIAITHIGQKLGTLSAELSRLEAIAADAKDATQRIYADDGIGHVCDRLHDLRWALASLEASTIPTAAIQCAAAVSMLEELEGRDDQHEAEVRRALHRLIASAANVLSRACAIDQGAERGSSGFDHLFPLHIDPWASQEARLGAV